MYKTFKLAALCAAFTSAVYAADANANDKTGKIIDLRPYTITGTVNATELQNTLIPAVILGFDELNRSSGNTLGEILKNTAGVHTTAFGQGASRPIIRGIGDHRVHVMANGMGISDVSANSPDHAVTVAPQFAEYIDIVRGPATLLYGNSAVGGLVNVIGKQIHSPDDESSLLNELVIEYESVSESINAFTENYVFGDKWAISANLSRLEQNDYRIPGSADSKYAEEEFHSDHDEEEDDHDEHEHEEEEGRDEHEEIEGGKLENSFVDSREANVSLYLFPNDRSRLSFSLYGIEKEYGVPGHEHHEEEEDHEDHDEHEDEHEHGVYVDLKNYKVNLDAEVNLDDGLIEKLKLKMLYSDYEHSEIEGGEVGTFFSKESVEMRMEGIHRLSDQNSGVAGIQFSNIEEESEGAETLTPGSENTNIAVFVLEEWDYSTASFSLGMRAENQTLKVRGYDDIDEWAFSASGALKYQISDDLSMTTALSRSERAPNATELYANGAHVATRQYEVGNSNIDKESVWSIDSGIVYEMAKVTTSINAFYYRFSDYIFAAPQHASEHGFQVFEYTAEDVTFYGFEFETSYAVFDNERGRLVFSGLADTVETDIINSAEQLPRIPPARIGLGVDFTTGNWSLWSDYRYAFEQEDHAENEYPSDDYHQLNIGVEYLLQREFGEIKFYLKASNLLNEDIRVHTSFLKDLAPLPGRNIVLGVNLRY